MFLKKKGPYLVIQEVAKTVTYIGPDNSYITRYSVAFKIVDLRDNDYAADAPEDPINLSPMQRSVLNLKLQQLPQKYFPQFCTNWDLELPAVNSHSSAARGILLGISPTQHGLSQHHARLAKM